MTPKRTLYVACALALGTTTGCSMMKFAVETQAEVMEQASPVIEEQTDYEVARVAIPASLIQVDGLLTVAPENESLLLLGAKGWGSYSYGFVEDAMQIEELAGNLEASDAARARARNMYLKARGLGFRLLSSRSADFESALGRDPDELRAYLESEFDDANDAPALFWSGYAWGSAIDVSRDDPTMLADLPFPRVLIERAVALDEGYYNAAGHVFLGVFHSSLGESVGGNPEKGREHFERALQLTQRQAHVVHVNYAMTYAVQKQDRTLFDELVAEVLAQSGEGDPKLALANTVARRRAQRLHDEADDLILPPLPPLPDEPAIEPVVPSMPSPAEPSAPTPATTSAPATTAPTGTSPAMPPAGTPVVPAPSATVPAKQLSPPKAPGPAG